MNKLTIILTFLAISCDNFFSENVKVISYNIRYDNPDDGMDIWKNRRSTIVKFISSQSPDFIGLIIISSLKFTCFNINALGSSE